MNNDQQQQNEQHDESITEQMDFTKPDFIFVAAESHRWRQQGPDIVCRACSLDHGTYIGMDYKMTGIDNQGMPILEKRV